jgi:hypothetical protein
MRSSTFLGHLGRLGMDCSSVRSGNNFEARRRSDPAVTCAVLLSHLFSLGPRDTEDELAKGCELLFNYDTLKRDLLKTVVLLKVYLAPLMGTFGLRKVRCRTNHILPC